MSLCHFLHCVSICNKRTLAWIQILPNSAEGSHLLHFPLLCKVKRGVFRERSEINGGRGGAGGLQIQKYCKIEKS